jgi:acyl-CoA thioesterase I
VGLALHALALLTLVAACSPAPANEMSIHADPGASQQRRTYLALGDSLAVGVGATRPSELGYPARLAARLGGLELRNMAISGETSRSFVEGGQLDASLDAIAGADPRVGLVTLDIGGNDLLRLRWTEPCASALDSQGCLDLVAETVAEFELNFRRIVEALAGSLASHAPDATLAVLAYPNSFSGAGSEYDDAAEMALLGSDGRMDCETEEAYARGLNDVIACVAAEHGAVVADAHPPFDGRGLELTHIGSGDIHANDRGYDVIAATFADALARGK